MARLRPARPTPALGLGACALVLLLGTAPAAAQTSDIFNTTGDWEPDNPPRLLKKPDYGNPPGSGAGKTGFVSQKRPQPKSRKRVTLPPPPPPVAESRTARAPTQPAQPPSYGLPPPPVVDPVTTASIPVRRKLKPELDPYEPLGIRAGSFILRPAIELSAGYDSNPHRTENSDGSSLFIAAPELKAKSDWERHELRADLHGSYTAYGADSSLDNPNFQSTINGRIDVTHRTRVELENRFLLATETPGSPNFQADVKEPTIYTTFGGSAGIVHQFNRLEVGVKAGVDRTTYRDSELTDGTTASNADRDLDAYGLELRGSYELTPGVKPFVVVEGDRRVHDLSVDSSGIQRDSKGFTPRIGTSFELSRLLTGDVSVGYTRRKYEDPTLPDLSGFVADASLAWAATPLTTAKLTANTAVYESIDTGVSGILARDLGVEVDHSFRSWLIGALKLGYGNDDYVGSSREDQRFSVGAELTYKLNREMQIKGEVRREQRHSNEADQDYAANIFLMTLRLQR